MYLNQSHRFFSIDLIFLTVFFQLSFHVCNNFCNNNETIFSCLVNKRGEGVAKDEKDSFERYLENNLLNSEIKNLSYYMMSELNIIILKS